MIPLIDGDILNYRIGYASDTESWPICRSRVDQFLESLLGDQLCVNDYEGWLTDGANNFRNKIAVTVPYKGNRTGNKPIHYEAIRNYLVNDWEFKVETEQEADDAIGIAATKLGDEAIIVTIDKDLDNIPGWHYNFLKPLEERKYYVTDDEARTNFYRQILTGDRIDNVVGLRGVGPVKGSRILAGLRDEVRMYEACVRAYGGDSERVVENGRLLWIRRHEGEIWSPPVLTKE
jgi:hypothetical protein